MTGTTGTCLAAATVHAALCRQTPVGNADTAGIEAATERFPRTVAWDTLQDYYGKAPAVARQLRN